MNITSNKNFILIRSIFFKTCLFFAALYFIFHFLNGNISYAALEEKRQLLEEKELLLSEKQKELDFKYILIDKIKNVESNLDLLDELVKYKLGYSSKDEIIFKLK